MIKQPAPIPILLAVLLTCAALSAQAGGMALDLYAPPDNAPITGLSAGGAWATVTRNSGDYIVDGLTGQASLLTGNNSSRLGYGSSLTISADGRYVAGSATAAGLSSNCIVGGVTTSCKVSQAALYDRNTGVWTTLGGLGGTTTTSVTGQATVEQSQAYGISSSGNAVAGQSWATVSGVARLHPFVSRDGQVYDLNSGGTTNGKALSISGDGSVVAGYKSNSSIGSIWKWNGSAYVASVAPTANNPKTNATVAISVDKLSENGVWAAGGSVSAMAVQYAPFPGDSVLFQTTLWNTVTNTGIAIPFDHVVDTTVGSADPARNVKGSVIGVSNSGVVIGMFNNAVTGANTGTLSTDTWIYNAYGDGKSMSFDSYLSSQGLALAPTQHVWQLSAMSADGSAISGMVFDSTTGASSAFLLHPTAAVPEPTTWAQLGLGLLAMGGMARARRRRD